MGIKNEKIHINHLPRSLDKSRDYQYHLIMNEKTISINELRRKFGEIEEALPFVDHFVLTKKGKPFALLKAMPEVKKRIMKKTAGALKGTELDDDLLWKDVLKR